MDGISANYSSSSTEHCPSCDSTTVQEKWVWQQFEFGAGANASILSANIPVCTCQNCGLAFSDERAEKIRNQAVCKHLRILTPEEIVAIRERHGMSQAAFASVSRIGRASLARWETGSLNQNASIDSLLFLLGFEENIERLERRGKAQEPADARPQENENHESRFRAISAQETVALRQKAASFSLFMVQ